MRSRQYIGQVERAERPPLREFAVRADEALGTGETLTWLWDELIADKVFFPEWFDWPQFEAKAGVLRTFQHSVVYGLLQTVDYANALLGGDEAAVAARMSRQSVLTRDDPAPPRVCCLLAENVLLNRFGTAHVMREQLDRLATAPSNVSVQIVPNGLVHPGHGGAFTVATLDDGSDVAYIQTAARDLTLTGRSDVESFDRAFDEIRALALPTNLSRDLITRTAAERWNP